MHRNFPRIVAILGFVVFGSTVSAQNENDSVSMFRSDPAHSGQLQGKGPDVSIGIEQFWEFASGGQVFSSPALADQALYFGSMDGNVYSVDAQNGSERWRFSTGGEVSSSPAVVEEVVYVGSRHGNLHALRASDGSEIWSFDTGEEVYSSPTIVDGKVFFGSNDGNLYALVASSGTELWRFFSDSEVTSSPAVSNNQVVFGTADGNLFAVDAETGEEHWRTRKGEQVSSSPSVKDGNVYVGSWDGNVYALDSANGSERWRFSTGDRIYSSPMIFENQVFVGSDDGFLYSLDATNGSENWRFATGEKVSSSPVVAGGVVYISGKDLSVHALDPASGNELWKFEGQFATASDLWEFRTSGFVSSSPAVGNGFVYIGSAGGSMFAIGNISPEREYINEIANAIYVSTEVPAGFSFGGWFEQSQSDILPVGWLEGAYVPVDLVGDGDQTSLSILAYGSADTATAAVDEITQALVRAGWQPYEYEITDTSPTCLSSTGENGSSSICYLVRHQVVLVTSSFLPRSAEEAVQRNALDLSVFASDVYDEVEERP